MRVTAKQRYAHLDGLRGLAALNVMVSHAVVAFDFAIYTGDARQSHGTWELGLSAWPLLPVAGANFSVCVFLVLSGFVLAHVFASTWLGMPALAVKRAVRLGLPVMAATVFGWAILASGLSFNHLAALSTYSSWLDSQLQQTPHLGDALREGAYGSLIGPWSSASSYDSSLWTMSIEFAGSLLLIGWFGLWKRLDRTRQSQRIVGLMLLMTGLALQPIYLSLMVIGASIRMLEPRRLVDRRYRVKALVAAFAVIALVLGTVPYSSARGPWWDALVGYAPLSGIHALRYWAGPGFERMDAVSFWHGVGAVLLVVAVECNPSLCRILSRRLPQYLGRISFPLYLVHVPVLMSAGCGIFLLAYEAGMSYGTAVVIAVATYMLAAVALASLAAAAVERPTIGLASIVGRAVQKCADQSIILLTRSRPGRTARGLRLEP